MAWIKMIEAGNAAGDLKVEYDRAIGRAGKIFNILKVQSLNPKTLHASMGLYLATMHTPSGLSRAERELLATVVSSVNRCFYWIEAHGEDLRRETGNAELAEQLKRDYRQAPLSPRQRALAEFAEKLTRTPAETQEEDLQTLRAQGFSDRDILDAVEVISYFNYINRVADGLGIDPEPEMMDAHRRWHT